MKVLILILVLAVSAAAQEWKRINELSGPLRDYPEFNTEFYATEISRGDDTVRLGMKLDFPQGLPFDLLRGKLPFGFDASSISRITSVVKFNCKSLKVKPVSGSAEIFTVSGQRMKSKEPPFAIEQGHIFSQYFCERGEKATQAPVLRNP